MKSRLKEISAVIVGWMGRSIVNMVLVQLGHTFFPFHLDPNDLEALKYVMLTLEPIYLVFPFLAHALGTLAGALLTELIASKHKAIFSISIGGVFLLGGIAMAFMLPAPLWFTATDLILAYLPMAFLGVKLVARFQKETKFSSHLDEI